MSQDVYSEPRPMNIDAVMRRVREASLKFTAETLTKMRQAFPTEWNEVYRLKGKKILPHLTLGRANMLANARFV